jgi:hypothetical protein
MDLTVCTFFLARPPPALERPDMAEERPVARLGLAEPSMVVRKLCVESVV